MSTEQSTFFNAARLGQADRLRELLANGADPDGKSNDGDTALTIASCANQTEIVRLLLANGADPNSQGKNERTVLIKAV